MLTRPRRHGSIGSEPPGRAVASSIVAYRTRHPLSPGAVVRKLGGSRSARGRLEHGEPDPSIETRECLASVLGLHFVVGLAPPGRAAPGLLPEVQISDRTTGPTGTGILVAAG
jgi:transcriptional regulator with XRE-family HTH domain